MAALGWLINLDFAAGAAVVDTSGDLRLLPLMGIGRVVVIGLLALSGGAIGCQ